MSRLIAENALICCEIVQGKIEGIAGAVEFEEIPVPPDYGQVPGFGAAAAGLLAILLCLCSFSMPAFASGSDPAPEPLPEILDEEPTTGGSAMFPWREKIRCPTSHFENHVI